MAGNERSVSFAGHVALSSSSFDIVFSFVTGD
jgi:hypothetical protein